MADNIRIAKYQFRCELKYVSTTKNQTLDIDPKNIKSIKIDHNYATNHMPTILMTLALDKRVIGDMQTNENDNYFNFSISKYNMLSDAALEITYFSNKFIYFLPQSFDYNDELDYAVEEQVKQQQLYTVTIGMMCIDHINNNKLNCSMTISGTKYDYVKYITSHMDNILIEPFNYNESLDNFIMPSIDSVSELLKYINDYRVLYKTPYRYYIDFDCTCIIGSSGKAITKSNETYDSITIDVRPVIQPSSNEEGIIINKTKGNHSVIISYVDCEVYDNTVTNKTKTEIKGITSTGTVKKSLKNKSSIGNNKTQSIRIKDGNDHMLDNIESLNNSSNVFVAVSKEFVDPSVFTINKRYAITFGNKDKVHDGAYLLTRKIEEYKRTEDNVYEIMLNLYFRKID